MFNADKVAHFMEWLKTPPDVPIESKAVSRSIRSAQTQVEQQNFEIRKDVLKYDDVLNRQRQVIYGERRTVLEGADLHEQIRQMVDEVVTAYVTGATSDGFPEEWDLDQLWVAFRDLYHPALTVGDLVEEAGGERSALSQEFIAEVVKTDAQEAYDRREAELTAEVMRELERRVVLAVLDHKWREHLYEMDYLREGIGLRAMAQRDPLVEYQREGFDMFNTMMEGIKEESVAYLFNSKVDVQASPIVEEAAGELPAASLLLGQVPGNGAPAGVIEDSVTPAGPAPVDGAPADGAPVDGAPVDGAPAQRTGRRGTGGRGSRGRHAKGGAAQPAAAQGPADQQPAAGAPAVVTPGLSQPQRPARLSYSAPTVDGEAQVQRSTESGGGEFGKVGRNAPCPCGSGRKYKLCHGDPRNRPAS
jgi:preprotein translocase subunit SecA